MGRALSAPAPRWCIAALPGSGPAEPALSLIQVLCRGESGDGGNVDERLVSDVEETGNHGGYAASITGSAAALSNPMCQRLITTLGMCYCLGRERRLRGVGSFNDRLCVGGSVAMLAAGRVGRSPWPARARLCAAGPGTLCPGAQPHRQAGGGPKAFHAPTTEAAEETPPVGPRWSASLRRSSPVGAVWPSIHALKQRV